MSDCSTNAWKIPRLHEMEEHVLYAPSLLDNMGRVDEIDVEGTRYVREPEGTVVNGVLDLFHPDVDESAVISVKLNGRWYMPVPEADWDAECEVD